MDARRRSWQCRMAMAHSPIYRYDRLPICRSNHQNSHMGAQGASALQCAAPDNRPVWLSAKRGSPVGRLPHRPLPRRHGLAVGSPRRPCGQCRQPPAPRHIYPYRHRQLSGGGLPADSQGRQNIPHIYRARQSPRLVWQPVERRRPASRLGMAESRRPRGQCQQANLAQGLVSLRHGKLHSHRHRPARFGRQGNCRLSRLCARIYLWRRPEYPCPARPLGVDKSRRLRRQRRQTQAQYQGGRHRQLHSPRHVYMGKCPQGNSRL